MRCSACVAIVTIGMAVALLPRLAAGHDLWLEADRHRVAAGEMLVVRQLVGHEPLRAEQELPLDPRLTTRFEMRTASGTTRLLADPRAAAALPVERPVVRRPAPDGAAVVVMEHDFILEHHSNDAFLEYLRHEELPPARDPSLLRGALQRERYARSIKCLVAGGGAEGETASDVHTRAAGQRIEILPRRSPLELEPGDVLRVAVLLRGEPLAAQRVTAAHRDAAGPLTLARGRTDETGHAEFRLDRAGTWALRLVHLRPCAEADGSACALADWESYWASLTFRLE